MNSRNLTAIVAGLLAVLVVTTEPAPAQESSVHYGRGVPSAVRAINDRSLKYLAATQSEDGGWSSVEGTKSSGITAIAIMAFLASGEDPDFGPYAKNIRRALRRIILDQNAKTGHITGLGHGSMYHHGFATLALSEAYGSVSERLLWRGSDAPKESRRSIGQALELAVRCTLTAQKKNPWGAWRYSPEATDADTTVTGTVLMGLLGARNAGMEIPNEAIDKALGFFRLNTMRDGNVSYEPAQSHGDGTTRTAIATLVYAVAKRTSSTEYRAVSDSTKRRMDQTVNDHPHYYRYYMAQALFHSDLEAWKAWNRRCIEKFKKLQKDDGSFSSSHGSAYGTGMAVLALALNYRLLPVYER